MSDRTGEWVREARQGSEIAVDRLLAEHLPGLRAYIQRHAGRLVTAKESAVDVAQSVCREVLQHLDRFQYDGEEGFRRWLYATALRKLRDRYRYYTAGRRDAARVATPDGGSSSGSPGMDQMLRTLSSPSLRAAHREEAERLRAAVERLPDRYREVVRMAYQEQLSRVEIGKRLGTTASHARVLLARALARLARELGEDLDG